MLITDLKEHFKKIAPNEDKTKDLFFPKNFKFPEKRFFD
jgi:hypothetical protein